MATTTIAASRDHLIDRYDRGRERSKAIFDLLGDETYYSRPISLRHPIVFYEGHLPAFSFNTLVKRGLGRPGIDARLEQLFARLRRAGLVKSARGPGGGYRLAQPAGQTFVGAIVRAVDEPLDAVRCDAESRRGCMASGERCLTHDLWDALGRQIDDFLSGVSLEDVVERRLRAPATAAA